MPHCAPMALRAASRSRRPSRAGRPSGPCSGAVVAVRHRAQHDLRRPCRCMAGPRYVLDERLVRRRRPTGRRVVLVVAGSFWGETISMLMPCALYACDELHVVLGVRRQVRGVVLHAAAVVGAAAHVGARGLLRCRWSVFIQIGGVQGLAQKRMLPLIACAALMYGISIVMSRLIENGWRRSASLSASPSRRRCSGWIGVVAGAHGDASHDEARAVGRAEQQLHRLRLHRRPRSEVVPAHLVERAAEAFPLLLRRGVVDGDGRGRRSPRSSCPVFPVLARRGGHDQLRAGRRRAAGAGGRAARARRPAASAGAAARARRAAAALPPAPAAPVVPALPLVPPPAPVVPPVPGPPASTQTLFVQCRVDRQQAVPHTLPAQLELQVVPLQAWPLAQTFVQLPQWAASDGTQAPLHSSWPLGHAHWLLWQVFPPPHGMPQAPQLFESVAVFTHSVPHGGLTGGAAAAPTSSRRAAAAVTAGAGVAARSRGASRGEDRKAKSEERNASCLHSQPFHNPN